MTKAYNSANSRFVNKAKRDGRGARASSWPGQNGSMELLCLKRCLRWPLSGIKTPRSLPADKDEFCRHVLKVLVIINKFLIIIIIPASTGLLAPISNKPRERFAGVISGIVGLVKANDEDEAVGDTNEKTNSKTAKRTAKPRVQPRHHTQWVAVRLGFLGFLFLGAAARFHNEKDATSPCEGLSPTIRGGHQM
ncbi:hypothetical protein F4810DRAFT_712587 [Camillea tinctor]|nr:hypothetical protein F4810DRAFT_712587 [Camillea tinctor]